jgi:hypothetical protein
MCYGILSGSNLYLKYGERKWNGVCLVNLQAVEVAASIGWSSIELHPAYVFVQICNQEATEIRYYIVSDSKEQSSSAEHAYCFLILIPLYAIK